MTAGRPRIEPADGRSAQQQRNDRNRSAWAAAGRCLVCGGARDAAPWKRCRRCLDKQRAAEARYAAKYGRHTSSDGVVAPLSRCPRQVQILVLLAERGPLRFCDIDDVTDGDSRRQVRALRRRGLVTLSHGRYRLVTVSLSDVARAAFVKLGKAVA